MNILIVDDNKTLLETCKLYLETKNYQILTADSAEKAMILMGENIIDLIVLDIRLPGMDGYEFCKKVKSYQNMNIIFMSSLGMEKDIVKGFMCGGSDYIVKPFGFAELECRIAARLLERNKQQEKDTSIYKIAGITIENGEVVGDNKRIALTEKELEILLLLARNQGKPMTTTEIYDYVWLQPANNDPRAVQTHLHNLRKKLHMAYKEKDYIKTKWGKGYEFKS